MVMSAVAGGELEADDRLTTIRRPPVGVLGGSAATNVRNRRQQKACRTLLTSGFFLLQLLVSSRRWPSPS